jgi:lipid II:glycine glycyltransferase (peptidoglycan interpeptide bridge formation enzyme)
MEIIFTKENHWLAKWDNFVQTEDKASHLLLSDWNKSFESYGFEYEVCILLDNDSICGGFVGVIAKVSLFKFYIVPFGPIVSLGFEHKLDNLIEKVPKRAMSFHCCYCHITIPFSEIKNKHVLNIRPSLPALNEANDGHLFKYVYSSSGLNWKGFDNIANEENLLNSFKSNIRRDIRSSIRKGLNSKILITESEIKLGYDLCLENAKINNYSIRDWSSFKETLLKMISNKTAKFIAAYKEEELKGVVFLVRSGNYYTYILGGTKKEKPDLLVGHFLQWEAIKMSFEEKLSGYNISLGGSVGVLNLKNSYIDDQIIFQESKYYWILKPFYFKLYLFFEKHLKNHKKTIAKFLSIVKR